MPKIGDQGVAATSIFPSGEIEGAGNLYFWLVRNWDGVKYKPLLPNDLSAFGAIKS